MYTRGQAKEAPMASRARARSVHPVPFLFAVGMILALASLAPAAAAPPPPSELQSYLDTLRKAGRSELAWGELVTVSSVKEHVFLLSFEKLGEVYVAHVEYPALAAKNRDLFPPLPPLQGLPPAVTAPRPASSTAGDDFQ